MGRVWKVDAHAIALDSFDLGGQRPAPLAVWLLLLVLSGMFVGMFLSDALTTEIEQLNRPESIQGLGLHEQRMDFDDPLTETIVVSSNSLTVGDPEFKQVAGIFDQLGTLDQLVDQDPARTIDYYAAEASDLAIREQAEQLISEDRSTLLIPVDLVGDEDDADEQSASHISSIESQATEAVKVSSVGSLPVNHTFNTISEEDLFRAEIVRVPIALIVLMVVFGAVAAALIPVGVALAAIMVSLGIVALIGLRFDLSFFITNMISVIGLAVGIDYALFVIERYREERRHGRSKREAIEVSGGTATKAIVFSGLTVVFSLLGLFLMPELDLPQPRAWGDSGGARLRLRDPHPDSGARRLAGRPNRLAPASPLR